MAISIASTVAGSESEPSGPPFGERGALIDHLPLRCIPPALEHEPRPRSKEVAFAAGGRPSLRVPGQAVRDVVIISRLVDEDVHVKAGAGGAFERPHRDRRPVSMERVPEERGAADRAEAATDL